MGKLGQTDLHMSFRNNPLLLTLPMRLAWEQTGRTEDLQSPVLRQGGVLAIEFWGLLGEPNIRTLLAQRSGLLRTLPPHSSVFGEVMTPLVWEQDPLAWCSHDSFGSDRKEYRD